MLIVRLTYQPELHGSSRVFIKSHYLSFTTSTKYYEGVITCPCLTMFPTCGVLTHTFSTLIDFSLTDFPPTSSEVVLSFLSFTPLLHPIQYDHHSYVQHVYPLHEHPVNTHYPGKVSCLCECEDRGPSPTLLLKILINSR